MTATLSGAGTQSARAKSTAEPAAQQMPALILRKLPTGGFLVADQPFGRRPPAVPKAELAASRENLSRPFSRS